MNAVNYSVDLLARDNQNRHGVRARLDALRHARGWRNVRVLEVGCGTGENLRLFADDCEVEGIEGLPAAVALAGQQGLKVTCADLERPLAVEDGRYDLVLCLDVLEHLLHPLPLLREIRRVLKPAGSLVLLVPNHLNLRGRSRLLRGRGLDVHGYFPAHDEWDNPHIRFFTHGGVLRLLAAAGYAVTDDRSGEFPCLPRLPPFRDPSDSAAGRWLARRRPDLFAAGFFIVAEPGEAAPRRGTP